MSDYRSRHLFGIGDFSRFTWLSVRMLRHYDERGLLKPVEVDPYSGYRYYSPDQLEVAARIRVLRDVGCGIEQIAYLLPLFSRGEELKAALAVHAQSLNAAAQQISDQQALLASIMNQLQENIMPITVQERIYPALRVLALRRTIENYNAEGALWYEFSEYLQSPTMPDISEFKGKCGTTYFDVEEYKESDVDVAIWLEYQGDFDKDGDYQILEFPEQKVAWATLVGPYEGTLAVCQAIGRWISEQGYELAAPMFNVNIVSPSQEEDPGKWVTEINYPIRPVHSA